jgi:integrase
MPGKQAKVVTPPMLKRMLRRVSRSSHPARDRAMILLSVKAGLRACEIAGLEWSMVLDAQGDVSGTIHVRDAIAKKRSGRRIPMHPDLRRALERLALTVEPVGPVIRSYRGSHLKANSEQRRQLVRRAVQGAGLRGLLVAFRPAQLHHRRRPQHPSLGMQPARRAAARGASFHRDDRTLHRRRHLGAAEARRVRVAAG